MEQENWIKAICKKVDAELVRLDSGIPYMPIDGSYIDMGKKDIAWWTNGFFPGMLWQLYHVSGNEIYKEKAVQIEEQLDQALDGFTGLHHDAGFMWLHTAVADFRVTGSEKARVRGLKAASVLASRFNINGNFIRAWNNDDSEEDKTGWTIIDSMMNIPLLHWASEELADPRFSSIAYAHAKTVQKYLVRKDGSVGHIAHFEPFSGEFLEQIGGQGYAPQSAWSRGQAWAIYGFALSYKATRDITFLETAIKAANYFAANISLTGFVPRVDFKAPPLPDDTDTSAALIACCGLLEIEKYVSPEEQGFYRQLAEKILLAVINEYCDFDPAHDGIVQGSTVAYDRPLERNVSLIYSDFFLIEAILKISDTALNMWY